MRINKIEVIDGYTSADERDLIKTAKSMSAGSGDRDDHHTEIIIKGAALHSK